MTSLKTGSTDQVHLYKQGNIVLIYNSVDTYCYNVKGWNFVSLYAGRRPEQLKHIKTNQNYRQLICICINLHPYVKANLLKAYMILMCRGYFYRLLTHNGDVCDILIYVLLGFVSFMSILHPYCDGQFSMFYLCSKPGDSRRESPNCGK